MPLRNLDDHHAGTGPSAYVNALAREREPADIAARLAAPKAIDDYPPGAPCPRDCGANLLPSREPDEQALCVTCGFVSYHPQVEPVVPKHLLAAPKDINRGRRNSRNGVELRARRRKVKRLYEQGMPRRQIAAEVGVSVQQIRKDLLAAGAIPGYQQDLGIGVAAD